jgi:bacteriocin-like protein
MRDIEQAELSIEELNAVSGGRMKQISAYRPPAPDTGPGHPQSSLQNLMIAEDNENYALDEMLPR